MGSFFKLKEKLLNRLNIELKKNMKKKNMIKYRNINDIKVKII